MSIPDRKLSDERSNGTIARMGTELSTTKQAVVDMAARGDTLARISEQLNIDRIIVVRWLANDPDFKQRFDEAAEAGSVTVLDDIKTVPLREDFTPARARVAIEAWRTYLELRFPQRYSKHVNLNVRTLDMNKALEQARQRAGIHAQVIDSTAELVATSTDGQSVDPFS